MLFEGVYRNATVALNGETLATHAYGYTPFAVTLDGKLHPGANTLTVTADNADAPSGRWYTGSGILPAGVDVHRRPRDISGGRASGSQPCR